MTKKAVVVLNIGHLKLLDMNGHLLVWMDIQSKIKEEGNEDEIQKDDLFVIWWNLFSYVSSHGHRPGED